MLLALVACEPTIAVRSHAPAPALALASASTRESAPGCPPDSPLTWRSFGAGFLRTWCTGCHSSTLAADDRQGAPDGVDFDRGASYRSHTRAVLERAVLDTASPMPPAGIIPEADRRRLAEWIACGSPGA